MNKSYVLLILLLVILFVMNFNTSYSQENFLPGYVISSNGDTIRGLIDYRNWDRNPTEISFRETEVSGIENFKPTDIRSFLVQDEIYVGAIVQTEISPRAVNNLDYEPGFKYQTDTAFLQTMVEGEKSLYFYKSPTRLDNYYIVVEGKFELLEYKQYLRDQGGTSLKLENNRYLGQLSVYFKDCPSIAAKIQTTNYSKKSLEKLFQSFYECKGENLAFSKKTEKIMPEFGVFTGVSFTTVDLTSETFPALVNTEYSTSVNFTLGAILDLILARNQQKWSINNELMYSSFQVDGYYEYYESEEVHSSFYHELGCAYIKLNTMVRFKYPVKNFFLFANIGISNAYLLSETNHYKEESTFYSQYRVYEGKAFTDDFRRYEQGIIFGLGGRYKHMFSELRMERGNGFSPYSTVNSKVNRYFILLGYRF